MTTYYHPHRYYGTKDAPLARLFVVTSPLGARIYARKSVDSDSDTIMRQGRLFHGMPHDRWIRILGGGWCTNISVREVA